MRVLSSLLLSAAVVFAQTSSQPSEGVHPRTAPGDYAAQATVDDATIAASALTPDQVKHAFAYDISHNFLVIEVAIYPGAKPLLDLRTDDFTVKTAVKADIVRASEPETVAAEIQRKNIPATAGNSIPVYGEANVGVESGTDPYSGRRVHTVYTGGGVGVGGPPIPQYPTPGGYPSDRALLEDQLWRKSLPEGIVQKPVAGYLYLPLALLKKEKSPYHLQFASEHPGSTPQIVDLKLPAKK